MPTEPGVGTNRFSYAMNDPVNLSDPGGNCAQEEALDGCLVTEVTGLGDPEDGDDLRVEPDNVNDINDHATIGDGSPRTVDFSTVQLRDLGASIQAIARTPGSSIQKAAQESYVTGRPVEVKITDVRATFNMFSSANSFRQQAGIGRFGVDIDAKISVDGSGNIKLNGRVTGIDELQDYPVDFSRNSIATVATAYGKSMQTLLGGQDFMVHFGGNQSIVVEMETTVTCCLGP